MKQYSMVYESDKPLIGNCYDHTYGYASSVRTAKQYITKCKKTLSAENPRNFRIFDHFADVDPATGFVPCVYSE